MSGSSGSATAARLVVDNSQEAAKRTKLAVPFADKDAAKAAGARWDQAEKAWYAPPGVALEPLQQWLPVREAAPLAKVVDNTQAPAQAPQGPSQRTILHVPFAEKDAAKAAGARWDRAEKSWYAPPGVPLGPLQKWVQARDGVAIPKDADPREQFGDVLRKAGLKIEGLPEMNGEQQRVAVEGNTGKEKSGWYVGHLDGRPAGIYSNHRSGEVMVRWKLEGPQQEMTAEARTQMQADQEARKAERAAEQAGRYARTAEQAGRIIAGSVPAPADHPYLAAKGVKPHGARMGAPGQTMTFTNGKTGKEFEAKIEGKLLLPVYGRTGGLQSIQVIDEAGRKVFMENGRMEAGRVLIGNMKTPGPLLIAEGFATGATVHEITGLPVLAALNAGNLAHVAQSVRDQDPERKIYIAADIDKTRMVKGEAVNVGRDKAEAAAKQVGGQVLYPVFPDNVAGTDWNDLAKGIGKDTTKILLEAGIRVADRFQQAGKDAAARPAERSGTRTWTRERESPGHER